MTRLAHLAVMLSSMNGTRPRTRPVAKIVSFGGVAGRRLVTAAWPGLAGLTAGMTRTMPARPSPLGPTFATLPVRVQH